MAKCDEDGLAKKFKGSLLGCLVGDCLGAKFEHAEIPVPPNRSQIVKFFEALRNGNVKSEPNRGYGVHVGHVFSALRRKTSFTDVFKPAREQFNGKGSYGNGGAMRVTPVGLFFYKSPDKVAQCARESALVSHAHFNGVNGAILQALAVKQAVTAGESVPLDVKKFVARLREEIDGVERCLFHSSCSSGPFSEKLNSIEKLLDESKKQPLAVVVELLGNDVTAIKSVPTAIYCFLAAQCEIDGIESTNIFERMMQYVITIGGDTDTIACMAGGICGAYFGVDVIPQYLIDACEGHEEILMIADKLYEAAVKYNETV